MYLEKIELYGFKSFNTRTTIPLSRGITAIVGPNGCGKSNVSDALRWVIGESNVRNLRGERIQDVIFKGSRTAKPMGMAEVSMVIQNDEGALPVDYAHVGISRRVFRSGESEFRINKEPCRLKDIKDLLSGTGLGSHGYAVIERSMIDDVLSEKDDTRRFLFEEAAGIVRYKQRRREAQRKLGGVEGDLVRIEDMVREIEREVRSLARQAGKVRRWRLFKEELDRLEVCDALLRWQGLMEQASSSEGIRRTAEEKREDLTSKLAVLEAQHESRRQNLIELGQKVDDGQRELHEAAAALASTHEEMKVLTTRNEAWAREEQDLRHRLTRDEDRLVEVQGELTDVEPRIKDFDSRLATAQKLYEEAAGEQQSAEETLRELRVQLQAAQQLNLDLSSTHRDTQKDLTSIQERRENTESRIEGLSRHLEAFAERQEKSETELQELEETIQVSESEILEWSEKRGSLVVERDEARARRRELAQERSDAAQERARLDSRLVVLEEQSARHEGFDPAVRWLLENSGDLPGFVGVVGEQVRLVEGQEELGQSVLGDRVSWVLVKNEDAAIGIISRLREQQLGGVTFFPLAEAGLSPKAKGGAVADLFNAEGSALPFVHYLAATTDLASNLEEARRQDRRPERRSASPDGLLFEGSGAVHLSGGDTAETGILNREQEIPALREGISELEARLGVLTKEETDCAARETELGEEIESAVVELTAAERARAEQTERRSALRTELGMLAEERDRLGSEQTELEAQRDEMIQALAQLEEQVVQSGEDSNVAHGRFEDLRARSETDEEEKDRKVRRATEREMEALRLENDLKELQSLRARLVREEEEKRTSVSEIQDALTDRMTQAGQADERIQFLVEGLETLQTTRRAAEASVQSFRDRHAEAQVESSEREQETKGLRSELESIVQSLHHEEVERTQRQTEAEQVRERILEEFEVDLAEWDAESGFPVPEPVLLEEEPEEDEDPDSAEGSIGEEANSAAATPVETGLAAGATWAAVDGESVENAPVDAAEEDDPEVVETPRELIVLSPEDFELEPAPRKERIVVLRRKIAAMGSLNYLAEKEYETQKERLDFHQKQLEDLTVARMDILEVIRQINETAGQMFQETFDKVQAIFTKTFLALFPGGESDLRLVGPDPLEGDVEIAARPKGKRLESIRLLSTGERSLTAIALLFSLYMIKPSPICLLDEVDAPLDDANLDRFLTMLKKMAEKTQFVMITHNKKTMKAAGNLFGVTMQEPGISSIVSVRLNETELDAQENAADSDGDAGSAKDAEIAGAPADPS